MNYEEMSLEQIDALLNDLDADRLAVKERGRQLMEVRTRKIAAENAFAHGMTAEQYATAKQKAAEHGVPFLSVLAELRRGAAPQLQVAKPGAPRTGAKAKGAGG